MAIAIAGNLNLSQLAIVYVTCYVPQYRRHDAIHRHSAHCTNLRLPYIFPSAPRRLHRSARPPTRAGVIRPIPSSVHLGWIHCCTTSFCEFCQLPVPPSFFLLSILLSPHRPHRSGRPPTRAGLIRPIPLSVHLGWIRCCTPATFSARGPLVFKFQSSRFRCSPLVSIILTFGT